MSALKPIALDAALRRDRRVTLYRACRSKAATIVRSLRFTRNLPSSARILTVDWRTPRVKLKSAAIVVCGSRNERLRDQKSRFDLAYTYTGRRAHNGIWLFLGLNSNGSCSDESLAGNFVIETLNVENPAIAKKDGAKWKFSQEERSAVSFPLKALKNSRSGETTEARDV